MLAKRTCACGCRKTFRPRQSNQKYKSRACQNRAGQARLRDRARKHSELSAEQNGVLGASNG
jgi:hypothetical protein